MIMVFYCLYFFFLFLLEACYWALLATDILSRSVGKWKISLVMCIIVVADIFLSFFQEVAIGEHSLLSHFVR